MGTIAASIWPSRRARSAPPTEANGWWSPSWEAAHWRSAISQKVPSGPR